jgi:hypothetical protein
MAANTMPICNMPVRDPVSEMPNASKAVAVNAAECPIGCQVRARTAPSNTTASPMFIRVAA